jgi:uncharacterized membrane protein
MHQLSQAKTLGGVGAILMLMAPLPPVGWLLSLAGAVMVLIAIKYISEIVQDRSIFNNMVIAIVLEVVGFVVGLVVLLETVLSTIGLGVLLSYYSRGFSSFSLPSISLTGGFIGLFAGVLIIWIMILISAIFVRRSYYSISKKLGVGMFETAGLLYLAAATFLIVLVGFVVLLVALIFNIVAFFSLADQQMPRPVPQGAIQPMIA